MVSRLNKRALIIIIIIICVYISLNFLEDNIGFFYERGTFEELIFSNFENGFNKITMTKESIKGDITKELRNASKGQLNEISSEFRDFKLIMQKNGGSYVDVNYRIIFSNTETDEHLIIYTINKRNLHVNMSARYEEKDGKVINRLVENKDRTYKIWFDKIDYEFLAHYFESL
ncbi:hypothetical protein [Sporosalibacterium faouarense]|uniref:hypothetical protein n=1 Tax=Sporosalibacterium faouarense TaxID=516123 RepID=UPI00192BD014|nr:hypothetical protein [Sporosalibacterium faouarense]